MGKVLAFIEFEPDKFVKRFILTDKDGNPDLSKTYPRQNKEGVYSPEDLRTFLGEYDVKIYDGVKVVIAHDKCNEQSKQTSPQFDGAGCATTFVVSAVVGICAVAYLIINTT